jgi:hypothetical protein
MSSIPCGVSVECNTPDSAQWKIVREFTRAKSAASSTFNISTWRKHVAHQVLFLRRRTTTNLSVSTVISVLVFMTRFIRVLQRETKPVSALVFDSDCQRAAAPILFRMSKPCT